MRADSARKRSLSKWFRPKRAKYSLSRLSLASVNSATAADCSDGEYSMIRSPSGSYFARTSSVRSCSGWSDDRATEHNEPAASRSIGGSISNGGKLREFECQIRQLKEENERLRAQMIEAEDESQELQQQRTELQTQLDRQKELLEKKLSITKRDVEEINGQLNIIDCTKAALEQEMATLRREKREMDAQLKEAAERLVASEAQLRSEKDLGRQLRDRAKKLWLLKEKETNERKVLLSHLKSAESFAKSQEEVILELLCKIKQLKREIIDKEGELSELRQRCISMNRCIDFQQHHSGIEFVSEIDVSFDYNKNELVFDDDDAAFDPLPMFTPLGTSTFLLGDGSSTKTSPQTGEGGELPPAAEAYLAVQHRYHRSQSAGSGSLVHEHDVNPSNEDIPGGDELHRNNYSWNELDSDKIDGHWKFSSSGTSAVTSGDEGLAAPSPGSCVDSGYSGCLESAHSLSSPPSSRTKADHLTLSVRAAAEQLSASVNADESQRLLAQSARQTSTGSRKAAPTTGGGTPRRSPIGCSSVPKNNKSLLALLMCICSDSTMFGWLLALRVIAFGFFLLKLPLNICRFGYRAICSLGTPPSTTAATAASYIMGRHNVAPAQHRDKTLPMGCSSKDK